MITTQASINCYVTKLLEESENTSNQVTIGFSLQRKHTAVVYDLYAWCGADKTNPISEYFRHSTENWFIHT